MTSAQLADRTTNVFYPVAVPVQGVGQTSPIAGAVLVGGWSFRETTGAAPAELQLWDGGPTGGNVIAEIVLAANQSIRDLAPGLGLSTRSALTVNVIAGSVRGSIWVADQ